ncbi:MAG: transcription termination/antitermination NusG family protein [Candidatus Korobacteraceae bacterium]
MSSLQTTPAVSAPWSTGEDWFALQTRTRFERKICEQVLGKEHEAYVPVTRERRRWSDRCQTVDCPLFPGYVFVREVLTSDGRLAILQTKGVYGFVTFNGVIGRIPEQQISDLKRIESQNTSWSPCGFLKAGQRVRVCGGCLDGIEGFFVAEQGKKLVISVEPLQRSIALDVDAYHLEPA